MRRDLPPRHRGSHCNLHAPAMPLHNFVHEDSPQNFLKFKGAGSSFSQKDALTPLAPSASPSPPLLPLPLPRGVHPCGCPCQGAFTPAAYGSPAAGPLCGRHTESGCARGQLLPLRDVAPASGVGLPDGLVLAAAGSPLVGGLSRGLAMGGRPCMGAGRDWPPLLVAFAAKIQQECIERFYAIQSHHTQFKTNLSYENLGSDTTVGKPQRVGTSHA
ncbi:hypothetical protein BHE74_00033106 [Ensete ventricosum]|nr:hypothetical protein BHE74_00033106 [Ensete ventricosum]